MLALAKGAWTGSTMIDSTEGHDGRAAGLRFSRRVYAMRVLGLALGALCIAGVMQGQQPHPVAWLLLAGNGLLWPHLAHRMSMASADPARAERRNMYIDSALGGAWIAAIELNLLPSALLLTMLSIDKVAAGGLAFMVRSWVGLVLVGTAAWLLLGRPYSPEPSLPIVLACIPFLMGYPLALSLVTYRLGLEVSRQNRRMEAHNRIDGLTSLPTRAHWEQAAAQELRRFRRGGRPAVLMMIDIDNFKAINDLHGHVVGDSVLKDFASELRAGLREIDTAGRYGGDEFGVVMPETGPEGAEQAARRLLLQVRRRAEAGEAVVPYSVSVGYALAMPGMDHPDAWIAAADAALYRAKAAGRNRASP